MNGGVDTQEAATLCMGEGLPKVPLIPEELTREQEPKHRDGQSQGIPRRAPNQGPAGAQGLKQALVE